MDDDDDFDVFAKIDSIVEQYNQTKVLNLHVNRIDGIPFVDI